MLVRFIQFWELTVGLWWVLLPREGRIGRRPSLKEAGTAFHVINGTAIPGVLEVPSFFLSFCYSTKTVLPYSIS